MKSTYTEVYKKQCKLSMIIDKFHFRIFDICARNVMISIEAFQ